MKIPETIQIFETHYLKSKYPLYRNDFCFSFKYEKINPKLEKITGKNEKLTPPQFLFTNCHPHFSIFPPKTHFEGEFRLDTRIA